MGSLRLYNHTNAEMEEEYVKRVITYGTFDMLHYGHINILRRAKEMGDYLVVVLSTDEFNWNSKQKKCYFTYEQRKQVLEAIRYVDLVIPENNWDQKISDVQDYKFLFTLINNTICISIFKYNTCNASYTVRNNTCIK